MQSKIETRPVMAVRAFLVSLIMVLAISQLFAQATFAEPAKSPATAEDANSRPYDAQIYRLSEILGAIHYLRELCGADEGQIWRNQMRDLVNAEGTSALRRARLVDSFNKGYRGYARTYRTCTKPAVLAINQFMEQGTSIAQALIEDHR